MTTADEVNRTAVAVYRAHQKDREDGGSHHASTLAQSVPWDELKPALDLLWALSAIDIETFSKDVDADAADMAQAIAAKTDAPAEMGAYLARIAHRHPSEVSLKVARNLMDHAIKQLAERKAR